MSPPQIKPVDRRRTDTRRQMPQPRPLWRRPWSLASGGAIAVLLVIGVMVWLARPGGASDSSPTASPQPGTGTAASAPGAAGLSAEYAHVFYGST
ncbi:MAG: hypothetical protein Q8O40_17075 [Chloroflexota bacterium]|nr:hypothetical protein [Chloroflexota bacterium]